MAVFLRNLIVVTSFVILYRHNCITSLFHKIKNVISVFCLFASFIAILRWKFSSKRVYHIILICFLIIISKYGRIHCTRFQWQGIICISFVCIWNGVLVGAKLLHVAIHLLLCLLWPLTCYVWNVYASLCSHCVCYLSACFEQ